jgi:hypothetical protein
MKPARDPGHVLAPGKDGQRAEVRDAHHVPVSGERIVLNAAVPDDLARPLEAMGLLEVATRVSDVASASAQPATPTHAKPD